MDFNIPADITAYLAELDAFIEKEIKPLERENDNIRFFDHRREWARTDFERDGLPRHEWEALLREMHRRADKAGHYRYALPREYGGKDGTNLAMAIIREHLAAKGLGLHNDLQNESSIVGNLPTVLMSQNDAYHGVLSPARALGRAEMSHPFITSCKNPFCTSRSRCVRLRSSDLKTRRPLLRSSSRRARDSANFSFGLGICRRPQAASDRCKLFMLYIYKHIMPYKDELIVSYKYKHIMLNC